MAEDRKPDFLIAGAPRSGTTWLYKLLDRHPEVYLAKPLTPEPKFFLVDNLYNKGISYYTRTWFSNVPPTKICGEKSTNYLESSDAAFRIKSHLSDVKLIFILRNPIDRAISNYFWSCLNGLEREDFETALLLEEKREKKLPDNLKYARPHAYFSRGCYAELLKPYFELFERKQILCLCYEDICQQPQELVKRLHAFLGVSFRPQDIEGLGIVNASKGNHLKIPDKVKSFLKDKYAGPNLELARLLGPDFQNWD